MAVILGVVGCGSDPGVPCGDCVLLEGLPADVTIKSVAADREGRIVAAIAGNGSRHVARMEPSGVLDPAFGAGGVAMLGPGPGTSEPGTFRSMESVVVMTDGSIRVGGEPPVSDHPFVFGFTADGHDDGFRLRKGVGAPEGFAISLMDQGGAVVVGFGILRPADHRLYGIVQDLVRYTAAGEPDPSFPQAPAEWATAIAPGGGFVMGGMHMEPTMVRFLARRVTRDGQPDPGFGGGAPVIVPDVSAASSRSIAVAPSAAGGLILAGVAGEGGRLVLFVARFDAAGQLDPSFGGGRGLATHDVLGDGDVHGVVEAAGGGIVVAGTFGDSTGSYAAAVGLAPDGALDPAFGDGGVVVAERGSSYFRSVVALPDGSVVAAGGAHSGLIRAEPLLAWFPAR